MRWVGRFLGVVASVVTLAPTLASADWQASKDEDPFNGDLHMAIAVSRSQDGYAVGFRCNEGDKPQLALIYLTSDRVSPETAQEISRLSVNVTVVVDNQPKVTLSAALNASAEDEPLRFFSFDPQVLELMKSAKDAKRRIAVAVSYQGKYVDTANFDVEGSTASIGELLRACKLNTPQPAGGDNTDDAADSTTE